VQRDVAHLLLAQFDMPLEQLLRLFTAPLQDSVEYLRVFFVGRRDPRCLEKTRGW